MTNILMAQNDFTARYYSPTGVAGDWYSGIWYLAGNMPPDVITTAADDGGTWVIRRNGQPGVHLLDDSLRGRVSITTYYDAETNTTVTPYYYAMGQSLGGTAYNTVDYISLGGGTLQIIGGGFYEADYLGNDDFGASSLTTGSLSATSALSGTIDAAGDRDWFRIELGAGYQYTFLAAGGQLTNPILRLYDANGNLVTSNDDQNGFNPEIAFSPTSAGTYYVAVGASGDTGTGTYLIGVGYAQASPFDSQSNFVTLTSSGGTWHALDGADVVIGSAQTDIIYGDASYDDLYGGAGNDFLFGGDSEDILVGGVGNDALQGGAGGDVLSELFDEANSGNDFMYGGDGVDIMYAAAGKDAVYGGTDAANNYADLGAGDDSYSGSAGSDVVVGGTGDDAINGNAGHDSLYGDAGNDTLVGGDGIDLLSGGADNDTLDGGNDADSLVGDDGNDSLIGGAGIDVLYGGAGDDTLNGGADTDALYGGAGNDAFRVGGTGFGADYVWDFVVNGAAGPSDTLVFQAGHFADATAVRNASVFASGNTTITVPSGGGATVVLVGVNIASILDEDINVNGAF